MSTIPLSIRIEPTLKQELDEVAKLDIASLGSDNELSFPEPDVFTHNASPK